MSDVVAEMPRRTAHAAYALVTAERELAMPVKAREVVIYDAEALSAQSTGRALHDASKRGLCVRVPGGLWVATNAAHDLYSRLEERFLDDTARGDE